MKHRNHMTIILISTLTFFTSCKQSDKNPQSSSNKKPSETEIALGMRPTGAFVSLSELTIPPNLNSETKESFLSILNSDSELLNDTEENSNKADCPALDNLKATANKNSIVVSGKIDATSCANSANKLKKYEVEIFSHYACNQTDLSSFNQKTIKELRNKINNLCKNDGETAYFFNNYRTTTEVEVSESGQKYTLKSNLISSTHREDGKPCVLNFKAGNYSYESCHTISKTIIDVRGKSYHNFSKLTYQGIKSAPNEKYFRTGKMAFQYNNWSGELTYRDGTNPPTYTAKSTEGLTASGTLQPKMNLNGEAESRQKFLNPFNF